MDPDLGHAHLQAELQVLGLAEGGERSVTLNIIWTPDHELEEISVTEHQTERGNVLVEQHDALVRRMKATGVVRISDPDTHGHIVTVTPPASSGALWDSSNREIWVTRPTRRPRGDEVLAQSCGAWTGSWSHTWVWNGSEWTSSWKWTWVVVWPWGTWSTS